MSYNNLKKIVEALSPAECIEERIKATEKLKATHLANVEAILTRPESYNSTWYVKDRIYGANLVTNAGDVYYAQLGAGDSVTNDFVGSGRLHMRTGVPTIAKSDTYSAISGNGPVGHNQSIKTGYPTTNDSDTDNTATSKTRKVTWTYEHGTSVANASGIDGGAIHSGGSSPGSSTPLLTHFNFSGSFSKTSTDTLKVIINHDFFGE